MSNKSKLIYFILAILIIFAVVGLTTAKLGIINIEPKAIVSNSNNKLKVVVSIYPLEYLAKEIGGELIELTILTPPGTEPHDYEPKTQDIVSLEKADILFMNGSGVEVYQDKLETIFAGSRVDVYAIGTKYATQKIIKEEKERIDPHVWVDPVIYLQMGNDIKKILVKKDPKNADKYEANYKILETNLKNIDLEYRSALSKCNKNKIVTSHTAFGYLASRYGFSQLGVSGLSPHEEVSTKAISDIIDIVDKEGIKYIFFETLVPRNIADTISKDTGIKTMVLDPIEGLTKEEIAAGESYQSKQMNNIANLKVALDCK